MKNSQKIAVFLGLFLLFGVPSQAEIGHAITYLSHDYDEINVFDGCSYYNLENFNDLAVFDENTLKIHKTEDIIGKISSLKIEMEILLSYSVEEIDTIIPITSQVCFENKTCYNVTSYNYTYKNVTKYKNAWIPASQYSKKAVDTQKMRICGQIERSWTYKGYEVSVDHVPEYDKYVYSQFAWWNNSFANYRGIAIENSNDTDILYANWTVNISLDTSDPAYFQSDCDDVRIVYDDVLELDRNITGCGTSDTQIWFQLQNNITPSTNDTDYKVYYNNPTIGDGYRDIYKIFLGIPTYMLNHLATGHPMQVIGSNHHINDTTPMNNNGTSLNYQNKNSYVAFGQGYSLKMEENADANSEYDITASSEFDTNQDDYAVSMWLYLNTTLSEQKSLVDVRTVAEIGQNTFILGDGTVKTNAYGGSNPYPTATSDLPLLNDTWNHLIVSLNSTSISYWINGRNAGGGVSASATGDLFQAGYSIHIGGRFDAGDEDYGGWIDNLYWFNTTITAYEIDRLHWEAEGIDMFPRTYLGSQTGVFIYKFYDVLIESPSDNSSTDDTTPSIYFNYTGDFSNASCEIRFNNTGYGINSSVWNSTTTIITVNESLNDSEYNVTVNCSNTSYFMVSPGIQLLINTTPHASTIYLPVAGQFCWNNEYLYVSELAQNGSIIPYLVYCQNGCYNQSLYAFGYPACGESLMLELIVIGIITGICIILVEVFING